MMRVLIVAMLVVSACTGEPSEAVPTPASPPSSTSTTMQASLTSTTLRTAISVEAVSGEGAACANLAALDGTVRPVYAWDCPVNSAAWDDADYTIKGRRGVLGWLYEDDPDGVCGFPGAYYECYQRPMRATLGGVLLEVFQITVDTPVWDEGAERYLPLTQELWVAEFYLGDHPESGEPLVGEFYLSAPGTAADGTPHPSRWRVCLLGNLLGGGNVSCLQAPPREISTGRMALQVLEVGRAYAFTVLYTFDPERVFADTDPRYTEDLEAWNQIVGSWVAAVGYARDLRARVQGEAGSDLSGPGLIMDVVLEEIPEDAT